LLDALNSRSGLKANGAAHGIIQSPDPALLPGIVRTLLHGFYSALDTIWHVRDDVPESHLTMKYQKLRCKESSAGGGLMTDERTAKQKLVERLASDYRRVVAPVRSDGCHSKFWDDNFVAWVLDRRLGARRHETGKA
jgi:hypothetical protein